MWSVMAKKGGGKWVIKEHPDMSQFMRSAHMVCSPTLKEGVEEQMWLRFI